MKNILVTTDFSEKSIASLHVAMSLAKQHNAKVYVLHAIELPIRLMTESQVSFPEAMYFLNLTKQRFNDLKKEIDTTVEVIDLVETAPLPEAVEEVVKKYHIDLVFMGSNGASGAKELFIGSNAEKVVRSASVPVLVIKNPHEKLKIKHMMFGCDFSKRFLKPFEKALKLAKVFGAKVDLNKRMEEFLKEAEHARQHFETHVYNDIRVETGILNYVKENDIDLICMFPNGRKGIAHFFNGSISSDLVNHSSTPVLTIKVEK